MRHRLIATLALCASASALATGECRLERITPSEPSQIGTWITRDNWQEPGHLQTAQSAIGKLMPAVRITREHATPGRLLRSAPIDLLQTSMTDPADGAQRSLAFILEQRLYADAVIAIQGNRVIAERYREGVDPATARPLLSATRPILSILAASAISDGRLAADKSVSQALSAGADIAGLRKLSVRRLLERDSAFAWSPAQQRGWQQAAGWISGGSIGIQDWLLGRDLWRASPSEKPPSSPIGSPEDDLLARVVASARRTPLAQVFCESVLAPMHTGGSALWLIDRNGDELAAGAALAPADFARLGQLLLESRGNARRPSIPEWLISALVAPARAHTDATPVGFPTGTEFRYGFMRLGGRGSRIALLGPYGTSLLIDFDHKIVIALFASYPAADTPLLHATLNEFWSTVVRQADMPRAPRR